MKSQITIKWLSLSLFILLSLQGYSQHEFPYGKMLKMSEDELIEAKFKYNKDRNQYVLTKSNGLVATANVLNAMNGTYADMKPHKDDYKVVIQQGELNDVSSISITFYDDEVYHSILTFANDKGKDLLATNSGKLDKLQFNYGDYAFVLDMKREGIQATTSRTNSALVKTRDESYNIYSFSIYTGVEPFSDWLTKEALKQKKNDEKGKKKQSAADLM